MRQRFGSFERLFEMNEWSRVALESRSFYPCAQISQRPLKSTPPSTEQSGGGDSEERIIQMVNTRPQQLCSL
ncbi:hypothetical protein AOLI_G00030470 [Acnodon oligacanthus]